MNDDQCQGLQLLPYFFICQIAMMVYLVNSSYYDDCRHFTDFMSLTMKTRGWSYSFLLIYSLDVVSADCFEN